MKVISQGKGAAARHPSGGHVEQADVQTASASLAVPVKQMEGRIGEHLLLPSVLVHWFCCLLLFSSLGLLL